MILIVASRWDRGALALADRLGNDACVLTCVDLSEPGWAVRSRPRPTMLVAGGNRVRQRDVEAVVTLLPAVTEAELPHIHDEDRPYVAHEMQAFLAAWLASLECPVYNRPTPTCLVGPSWPTACWRQRARVLGIPAAPIVRSTEASVEEPSLDGPSHVFQIVGPRCIGADDVTLSTMARTLADAAGVQLLTAVFACAETGGYRFVEAVPTVGLHDPTVVDAVAALARTVT